MSGITDRVDARSIILLSTGLGGLAALGFAFLAEGFWTPLGLRFLSGVSLAGTYMPGLKLVSDHAEGGHQSRHVAFYTASFSIGVSVSYLLAGEVNKLLGWRWAFAFSALGSVAAFLLIFLLVPRNHVYKNKSASEPIIDFRPVFKTGTTLGVHLFVCRTHVGTVQHALMDCGLSYVQRRTSELIFSNIFPNADCISH